MARKYALVAPLALALLLLFLPMSAGAAPEEGDTVTVIITATGYVVSAPTGLSLSYIDDHAIEVAWTKGVDADNTMVRAAYGYVPSDREDGYLVYYGNGTSTRDTAVDLSEWTVPVYYRAWSESGEGIWEDTGVWDSVKGAIPTAIQAVLVVGAAAFAAWRRHIIIYVAAFLVHFFVGIQLLSVGSWAFGLPTLIFGVYFIYSGAWAYWQRRASQQF